jgi:hypothetical protein
LAIKLNKENVEEFTSHSMKRTSLTNGAENSLNNRELMTTGEHKSIDVSEGYIESSNRKLLEISKKIIELRGKRRSNTQK